MRLLSDSVNVVAGAASASLSVTFDWEMGHRLPNHDGHCSNLHGHHYTLHVTLVGPVKDAPGLPDEGMVIDFQEVKKAVKWILADYYDHKFLISNQDPLAAEMSRLPGVLLVEYIPTAENIALYLKLALAPHIPQLYSVKLYETPGCCVEV